MDDHPIERFSIIARLSDVRLSSDWLNGISVKYSLPPNKLIVLDQCLDETLMNIIMHGGMSAESSPIELCFQITAITDDIVEASITVSDAGLHFNPCMHIPKALPTSLEDAFPGGLGIRMIQRMSDRLEYCYQDGKNVFTFSVHYGKLMP